MRMLFLLLAACGAEGSTPDATVVDASALDGSIGDAAVTGAEVEVGTGASAFEPIQEGERLELVMAAQTGGGAQGFHFNAAVRTRGLDPSGAIVHFTITRERDATMIADVTQQVNLIADGDHHVGYGFRAVVTSCGDTANEMLRFAVQVMDASGASGDDARGFVGPMYCPR